MTAQVGVLGLGEIGGGVARALASAGHEVVAHDVRDSVLQGFADVVSPAASSREVADVCQVVLIAVFDDDQVRTVLSAPDGLLASADPPADVVVLSTVTLDTIRWAEAACAERGVSLLDCGVTGGPQALAQSSIVSMVGGEDQAVARVMPVLEAFSSPAIHTGPLGTGMQAKLARNLLYFAGAHIALEAARLAKAAGVAVETLVEIVDASDKWTGGSTAILKRGFTPEAGPASAPEEHERRERMAGFARKDLAAALKLGAELGVDLPAAELAARTLDAALGVDE